MKSRLFRVLIIALALMFSATPISAQNQVPTDSVSLSQVVVTANRLNVDQKYLPARSQRIDSLLLRTIPSTNLSEIINLSGALNLVDNGPGGLATVAIQGMEARHTQIVWEGFSLNHSMLGLTDLNLVPSSMLSGVEISSMGGSAFGSGASAGSIILHTGQARKYIQAQSLGGAFGERLLSTGINWSQANWSVEAHYQRDQAEMDFPFRLDQVPDQTFRRELNAYTRNNLLLGMSWNPGIWSFSSKIWLNHMENQIPGASGGFDPMDAEQFDQALRWVNTVKYTAGKSSFIFRSLFVNQDLDYRNNSFDFSSLSNTRSLQGEVEWRRSGNRYQNQLMLNFGSFSANSTDFLDDQLRRTAGAQWHFMWRPLERLRLFPALRVEEFSDLGLLHVASIGINLELVENLLFFRTNAQQGFTAPTFNDLYFPFGGNPNLDKEEIRKLEFGLHAEQHWENFSIILDQQLFQGWIENGIRWLPDENGVFGAENIESLRNYGWNGDLSLTWKLASWNLNYRGSVTYTRSFIDTPRFAGDAAVRNQFRYIPEWMNRHLFILSHRSGIGLNLTLQRTGSRFVTNEHSNPVEPLQAFSVVNTTITYSLTKGRLNTRLLLQAKNLLDEQYQFVLGYPHPGRHLRIGISIGGGYRQENS